MAWGGAGGGGGMFGGGGGGMFGGRPGGSPGNPGSGLPFAGIPSELQDGVDKLLKTEPEHGEPTAQFSYQMTAAEQKKMTLRQLVLEHWHLAALAGVLVTIVSLANQAGPALIDYAITHGMGSPSLKPGHLPLAPKDFIVGPKDFGTIVVCAAAVLRGHPGELLRPAQSGQGHRPPGRLGHERPADQDLHPPAAHVARLLHR